MLRYTYITSLVEFSLKRDVTCYSVCAGNEIRSKSVGSLLCQPQYTPQCSNQFLCSELLLAEREEKYFFCAFKQPL